MASNHYVNNPDFLAALKKRREDVEHAKENNLPVPQIDRYIGEAIMLIANRLSHRPNFSNYTYRDEMIEDGIENCITYIDNFDPAKSSNPFAYFTQIIYFAFIRRIQKEKRQVELKARMILDSPYDFFDVQEHDEDNSFAAEYIDSIQSSGILDEIAKKDKDKKLKKSNKGTILDDVIDE